MMIAFEPGDGHHDSELARQIIAEFDVHENDMPARRIIQLGREAGLRRHLVLPFPWNTLRHLYRPGYARARSTGELFRRYCLGMGRLLLHLCGRRKEPGFVVLWK
jgi:hypothetical protein